jgi:hypothetical protein
MASPPNPSKILLWSRGGDERERDPTSSGTVPRLGDTVTTGPPACCCGRARGLGARSNSRARGQPGPI